MQALVPDSVDMSHVGDGEHWYVETASRATVASGEVGVEIALAHLRERLGLSAA
jgi:hypothetical protein